MDLKQGGPKITMILHRDPKELEMALNIDNKSHQKQV